MADKERQINERSLENLKLGAQARYQGKIRQNVSILPETSEWLKCSGNASGMIDDLVAAVKNGELRANYTHERTQVEPEKSNSVYKQIEALKAEAEQLRAQLVALEQEKAKLVYELAESERQKDVNQSYVLPDYEAARSSALAKLKLGKQSPDYKRSKKAMDLMIAELKAGE